MGTMMVTSYAVVWMVFLSSFTTIAEELRRKRHSRAVYDVEQKSMKERDLFVDSEDSWLDLFNNAPGTTMSLSMSMPPPPPRCPPAPNTDQLYQRVTPTVLNRFCQDVYGDESNAVRDYDGGYDWECENGSISQILSIADVCQQQFSSNHVEVLLGGTADDWACVDWTQARFAAVPVIIVASDYVSKENAIADATASVAATTERVRAWYERKMSSGKTFQLASPILHLSTETSDYWNELSCLTGSPEDRAPECNNIDDPTVDRFGYFYEAEAEAKETSLGENPQDILVLVFVYTGPDSEPFGLGAAARAQFSVNPPSVAVCDDERCGLYSIGHEMGHSFGLGHSCDFLPEPECYDGIMQNPPDILTAVLFPFEQDILDDSCFFSRT